VRDIFNKFKSGGKLPADPESRANVEMAATPAQASAQPDDNGPEPGELDEGGQPDERAQLDKTMPLPAVKSVEGAAFETMISAPGAAGHAEPVLRVGQRCHVGAVRNRNEDSCLTFVSETGGQEPLLPIGLFIVADGMGGHYAGHEASKTVSRLVARHVLAGIYTPLLEDPASAGREPIQEVMLRAVKAANEAIFNPNPEKEGGTTVTAALVLGRRLYLVHVGDSRGYLYTDGKLEQITTDHSYVQRLQEAGQLTAEEAAVHPQRNVLYRAVGQGDELEIDAFTRALPRVGKLLLCSDGLWGLVPEGQIKEILGSDASPQEMVESLVEMALQGGGHDNITGVLVDFIL
jgi:protein phosphatase